jgi:ubiquitin-conjugating enzyme E2 Q
MSLGFGPSIEHEILTQPSVVDLLISFCYASARGRRLREYPTGMSLSVPPMPQVPFTDPTYVHGVLRTPHSVPQPLRTQRMGDIAVNGRNDSYTVKYDHVRQEAVLDSSKTCPLRRGDWITLIYPGKSTSGSRNPHQFLIKSRGTLF